MIARLQYFLYNLFGILLAPFLFLHLLWKSRHNPDYRRRWLERLACAPQRRHWHTGGVLIHAVSVGELNAARPVIKHLLERHPDCPVTVTTTTPTASDMVAAWFPDQCQHCYLPFDLPWLMRRLIGQLRPQLLLLLETELWPNLILSARESGTAAAVINARCSAATLRLFRCFPGFAHSSLSALDWIAAQSREDAQRFIRAGAGADSITVVGNLKMDVPIDALELDAARRLRAGFGERQLLVAGSTHEGEEALLAQAFLEVRKTFPGLMLVLAPRHPERAAAVAQLCRQHKLQALLASRHGQPEQARDVIIVDVLGRLLHWYGAADVVFLGGTLVAIGGHNPIEAAAMGTVQIIGPYRHHIEPLAEALAGAGAARLLNHTRELPGAITSLLEDPELRRQSGRQAKALIAAQQGAQEQITRWIDARINSL